MGKVGEAKHTPTPWEADWGAMLIDGSDGRAVAVICTNWRAIDEYRANLSLIVECVNSHATLVKQRDELLALVKRYASECVECGGTGNVPVHGIEESWTEVCSDCADIRAALPEAK